MTRHSKLYALNSETGDIVWQYASVEPLNDFHYFSSKEGARIIVVISCGQEKATIIREYGYRLIHRIEATSGQVKGEDLKLPTKIVKSIAIHSKALNPLEAMMLLLISDNGDVYTYPNTAVTKVQMSLALQRLTLCDINQHSHALTGYRVLPHIHNLTEVWRLNLKEANEEIIAQASDDQLSKDEYQPFEENNGNILYKYVNPNLVAVVTFSSPSNLYIYIVSRTNGTVLYTGHVYNVYDKNNVRLVFSENTIIVSYLKKYVCLHHMLIE